MSRVKFMLEQFLAEPWWFKLLISITLLVSVIFSGFERAGYQSGAKLAAALFFVVYGVKFWRSRLTALLLLAMAVVSLYLSWQYLQLV